MTDVKRDGAMVDRAVEYVSHRIVSDNPGIVVMLHDFAQAEIARVLENRGTFVKMKDAIDAWTKPVTNEASDQEQRYAARFDALASAKAALEYACEVLIERGWVPHSRAFRVIGSALDKIHRATNGAD